MPKLSWNEIQARAIKFSKNYENIQSEKAESQSFYNDFFQIFGIERRRIASFEYPSKKADGNEGSIDVLWKGKLLCEQKSAGKSLIKAKKQALDYFPGLKDEELPQFILTSNFQEFYLTNLDTKEEAKFKLNELSENIYLFDFIAGYEKIQTDEQDPVNQKAAKRMARLHELLFKNGYRGENLEILLTRILFCLFADDAGIFQPRDSFLSYIVNETRIDGTDLGMHLNQIFQVLDRPEDTRQNNLNQNLLPFPYINGNLFSKQIPIASFDKKLREELIECCYFDWKRISPSIFGSLFQASMDPDRRRSLGAHYTSEENILKLISPLFLDELKDEIKKTNSHIKLKNIKEKIGNIKILDPACGCGNFLVISYRELRKLELEIIKKIDKIKFGDGRARSETQYLDLELSNVSKISLNNFIGFEIDILPSKIAELSMWLVDHQMNIELSNYLGNYFAKIPLIESADVFKINSNTADWDQILKKEEVDYIIGNPPFIGSKERNKDQQSEMKIVFDNLSGAGDLDYVTCWFKKASDFIHNTKIKCAFVATNSITQGQQPGPLWESLNKKGIKIDFGYRTFTWSNEAEKNANVHVVIIGFSHNNHKKKILYEYKNDQIFKKNVTNINGYLLNAKNVYIKKRSERISQNLGEMIYGSIGYDENNFFFNKEEYENFIKEHPDNKNFLRRTMGSKELINNNERWCLWLEEKDLKNIQKNNSILNILKKIKDFRSNSQRSGTRQKAQTPYLFGEIRQPNEEYIGIPKVSSINREYLPIDFLSKDIIATGSLQIIKKKDKLSFGILSSNIFSAWLKNIGGKTKSDYQNSITVVYNNFPFPKKIDQKLIKEIEQSVDNILLVRKNSNTNNLADLYNPLTCPKNLLEAHQKLDKAVHKCYGKIFKSEMEIIEHLFDLYSQFLNN